MGPWPARTLESGLSIVILNRKSSARVPEMSPRFVAGLASCGETNKIDITLFEYLHNKKFRPLYKRKSFFVLIIIREGSLTVEGRTNRSGGGGGPPPLYGGSPNSRPGIPDTYYVGITKSNFNG